MIEIIPSILSNNTPAAFELLSRCEGVSKRAHIDVIDGQFVDNKTVQPIDFADFDTSVLLDYHLMVKEPVSWLEQCIRGQASRVIAQVEQMADQVEFIKQAQILAISAGLAIDLDTPLSAIDDLVLTDVDEILIISVKAGWGGQKFHFEALEKAKELISIRQKNNMSFRICIDGGETTATMDDTYKVGVDEVVIGRRLFDGDLSQNLQKFLKASES